MESKVSSITAPVIFIGFDLMPEKEVNWKENTVGKIAKRPQI